ncbi:MAG: hypothetical protein JNK72_24665 [Myxococcales bacterium]|nr:hypothetical protein [Myxococcales bacterium]
MLFAEAIAGSAKVTVGGETRTVSFEKPREGERESRFVWSALRAEAPEEPAREEAQAKGTLAVIGMPSGARVVFAVEGGAAPRKVTVEATGGSAEVELAEGEKASVRVEVSTTQLTSRQPDVTAYTRRETRTSGGTLTAPRGVRRTIPYAELRVETVAETVPLTSGTQTRVVLLGLPPVTTGGGLFEATFVVRSAEGRESTVTIPVNREPTVDLRAGDEAKVRVIETPSHFAPNAGQTIVRESPFITPTAGETRQVTFASLALVDAGRPTFTPESRGLTEGAWWTDGANTKWLVVRGVTGLDWQRAPSPELVPTMTVPGLTPPAPVPSSGWSAGEVVLLGVAAVALVGGGVAAWQAWKGFSAKKAETPRENPGDYCPSCGA